MTDFKHLKYKIVVSGAAETGHCAPNAHELAFALGQEVVRHNCVLVTGATTGMPLWAAKGAKEAGGIVVGISPASSLREHVEVYDLPIEYHDLIIYTGFHYSGRNLLLTRAGDGVLFVCGRMGTLNEFTISFEDQKPMGVLVGSGGIEALMDDIVRQAHRGSGKIVWDADPKVLVEKVIELIKAEEKK